MAKTPQNPSIGTAKTAGKTLRETMRLQEIEGNPLDAEQVALFEMFERGGWSDERRLAYLRERAQRRMAAVNAAE